MNKVRLGDMCTKSSSNIKQSDLVNNDGDYPIFGASGFIKNVDFYTQNKPYIGIVKDGAGVGRVMKLPAYSSVIGTMQYIIPNDDIDVSYLAYAMEHMNLSKYYMGAAIPHIYFRDYKHEELPNHTSNEQAQIVHVLNLICNQISKRNDQLSKLDELIKSRFVEMFGDPIANTSDYNTAKLRDLSIKISDGVHAKPEYTDTGRPFLSVVNINRRTIDFSNCKYVSEEAYQKMIKSTHPEKGDILYTKVGATYGIPAYVDTDIEFCLYVSVCLIKPKHELINSKFLAIQLDMPFVKYQADKRIKGIGVPDLHLNQISEFEIILPPRELQNQFADFVTQVEKQKATVQQSIDKLETLKKSLMQEYFG